MAKADYLGLVVIDPELGVEGIIRVERQALSRLGKVTRKVGVCTADFHGGMRVKHWYPVERVQAVGAHAVIAPRTVSVSPMAEFAYDGLPTRFGKV